jgi:predicted transposase/invertase (TIGR01784 family)
VLSIWLLTSSFFTDDKPHHHFEVWDRANDLLLTDNCSIHVFELEKWRKPETLQAVDFWLYFFKEGKHWTALPKSLAAVPQLRLAMKTLEQFSEREAEYHLYQSRQDAIRVQLTQEAEFAQERALKEQAQARADEEKQLRLKAQARADAAEALLAKAGK